MADYEDLKKFVDAHRRTQSRYVRERLAANIPERSNGESALAFFVDAIKENALYLLDEPENSLSAERQQELVGFIEDSARFYGCQFIIASHSPILLGIPNAHILSFDDGRIHQCAYEETESYKITKAFISSKDYFLHCLLED